MGANFVKQLACWSFGVIGITVFAQKEIRSKIIDFSTLLPIESASIYIKNTTVGTVSNSDGKFVLLVDKEFENDTLIISSIGFKSFKSVISAFENNLEIYLEEDIAALDEVVLLAESRPTTGNEIVQKAIEKLEQNLPELPYVQKGFLRHKERNKKEFKWLIESAITLYDSSYSSGSKQNLRINVDEVRKSYDLRDVDSIFSYYSYLKHNAKNINLKSKRLDRDTIETASLVKAIKWNDTRVNGLANLFKGRLNLLRNSNMSEALFGDNMLDKHQFELDTILVDNDRKLYKIKITKSKDFVGLNTENIYNEGYEANGWLYIYWDNYAVKKIEYELVAASEAQKGRSKTLFDTQVNHKLIMTYMEYEDKMYPNYFYYETPKLVNIGFKPTKALRRDDEARFDKDERYYYTVQEILFTEIILDPDLIVERLKGNWSEDIFSNRPYNETFWKHYNVLLESEEEEKLIQDLSQRASLFKQ